VEARAEPEAGEREIDGVRAFANSTNAASLKSGDWFASLLRHALDTYSKTVSIAYFRDKYPGLPADAIAARRIELAQRYAMIEGGITATAYTAAIAATIGTGGGASPLTVPGALASFSLDLFFISQLQLRLAFDLAVLYGHPIDMNDPADLYDLLRVAFGVKAGEVVRCGLRRVAPEAIRQGAKAVVQGPVLAFLQTLPLIGQYLLQRNVIKFAVPAIGIPVSMNLNHYATGRVGAQARESYRHRAAIDEATGRLVERGADMPSMLLETLWLFANADGTLAPEETWMMRSFVREFEELPGTTALLEEFASMINFSSEEYFKRLEALSADSNEVLSMTSRAPSRSSIGRFSPRRSPCSSAWRPRAARNSISRRSRPRPVGGTV
jgi:hypothetical protein